MRQQLGANKRRDKRADLRPAAVAAAAKILLGGMPFVSETQTVTWMHLMAAQTRTQDAKRYAAEKDRHRNCLGFEGCPYERGEKGSSYARF